MPDLLAGTTVNALDTPPTVNDLETGVFTFTITTYGVATSGGTYADCGVAFVGPTSGRVVLKWRSTLTNSGAAIGTLISPVVRTGGTVGTGTVVAAASDDVAIQNTGTA